MNEMDINNRDYDNRDYRDYRDYRNYRDDEDYRNYRDYRTRDYDRRGGRLNNKNYRNYRNYRNEDYFEELEMVMEDMREIYRKIEDISEMATNSEEKNAMTKIAQKEKENYMYLKQMIEK